MSLVCELMGHIADSRIRKATILYESRKEELPIETRVILKEELNKKIDEIKKRKKAKGYKLDDAVKNTIVQSLFKEA